MVIIKKTLRLETAELIRVRDGEDFIQGIVIVNRLGRTLVLLYSAPTVGSERFGDEVKSLLSEYNVHVIVGDLNARLLSWCTAHDAKKKGMQLLRTVRSFPGHAIHAPQKLKFQAPVIFTEGALVVARLILLWPQYWSVK